MTQAQLTHHDLGNNEGIVTGLNYDAENADWVAFTRLDVKRFKTEAGAVRFLARRGYAADGTRLPR